MTKTPERNSGYFQVNEETSIAERLRKLMYEQNIGENELARRSKVSQPTIHRILNGMSKSPRISNLEQIAGALGVTTSFLAHGGGNQTHSVLSSLAGSGMPVVGAAVTASLGRGASPTPRLWSYPVLTWSEAMEFNQLEESGSNKESQYISTDYKKHGTAFWLRVRGEAMAAPIGASPSLPEGTLVLFDTGLPVSLGKLVLACLPDGPALTFRKLIEESGQRYLQPLNPSYPLTLFGKGCSVLAVAVEAKTAL